MDEHLDRVVERYAAISVTPEFRANLEVGDRATLAYHAQSLIERLGASTVAFLSPQRSLVASAGNDSLRALAVERLAADSAAYLVHDGALYACVTVPLLTGGRLTGHLVHLRGGLMPGGQGGIGKQPGRKRCGINNSYTFFTTNGYQLQRHVIL